MLRPILISSILLGASAALAGSMTYDFRFDMRSTDWSDKAADTGNFADGYRFEVKTGRVDFKGKLNEEVSYRLRWRFDKSQANTIKDNVGAYVDHAHLVHQVNDTFAVTAGKFASEMGGAEATNPSPDEYLFSDAYNDVSVGSFGQAGTNLAIKNTLYYAGVKVAANFGDHEVAVHAANPDELASASQNTFNQNKGYFGVVYKGKFFEETWNPILSYHTSDVVGGTATEGAKKTFIAFGNNIKVGDFAIEADYLMNTFKNTPGADESLTGMDVNVAYNMGALTPKFKYATSERSTKAAGGTAVKFKADGISLALEYKPTEDKFRYHVAYNMNTYKPDAGQNLGAGAGETITNSELVAGVRLVGDFLK